jgi:NADH dehydrogenase
MLSRWQADFVEGEVEGVDWEGKQVLLRSQPSVPFDYLVVALGAETNFFGISGLQENSFTLKSVRDADRLRQRIHDLLHKREKGIKKRMEIVVGGGGATGVEFAAELTMFLRRHMVKGHLKPDDFNISLVEAQPRILGALPPELSSYALARLRALGVHVYLDSAVKEVAMGRVILVPRACKPGETADQLLCDFRKEGQMTIESDLVVWTGGIRGSKTLETLGIGLDARGRRVEVGPSLEIAGKPGAFAIGDSALLMDPKTKQPVPWLAQAAMAHGAVVARTIAARIVGGPDAVDAAYGFPKYPVIVPLGGKFAIARVDGVTLRGVWGWMLKEIANLRYFLSILALPTAFKKWWHGALTYSKND